MSHNGILLTLTLENSLIIGSLCYTTLHTPINLYWTSLCWWNPSAMTSVMAHSFSSLQRNFYSLHQMTPRSSTLACHVLTLAAHWCPRNSCCLKLPFSYFIKYTLKCKILKYWLRAILLWLATQSCAWDITAKDQLSWEICYHQQTWQG